MKPIGFAARGHGPKSLSDSAIWQFGQAPMQKPDWGAVSEVNRKKFKIPHPPAREAPPTPLPKAARPQNRF
jgi:hypothetical protein